MILEEETYRKFGYYPRELLPHSGKKILATCDDCGKVRILFKYAYRALCPSCSCKGEKHRNWKGGKVKVVCDNCGTNVEKDPCEIKKHKHHFCNRKCQAEWASKDQEYQKHLRRIRSVTRFPNKPELIFQEICERNNLPFLYVGDGQLWIGKKKKLNPDFIATNNKKIIVEILGDYWHSPLINRNMKEHGTLTFRKNHYRKFKWIPVFIWTADLDRKDAEAFVLNKLQKEGAIK